MAARVVFLAFILCILFIFCKARLIALSDIHHLEGSHNGETLSGVNQIKSYLKQFGYLSYDGRTDIHGEDDYFDGELESAVKTYQRYYHLNVTGILDKETIKAMAEPRCGMPDITPLHNHDYDASDYHFNASSHFTFIYPISRWPPNRTHLSYFFVPPYKVKINDLKLAFYNAFASWSVATNRYFTFQEVEDIKVADLKIMFVPNTTYPGTLAVADAPTGGVTSFNQDIKWVIGISPDGFDLESVARHEIGHLIGLGHSTVMEAVMFPSFSTAIIKPLTKDDYDGIRALYNIH